MHKTMFDTLIIKDILRLIALLFLKLTGWKAVGQLPQEKKYVLIAAPHTSNWDLPYMLAITFVLRAKIYWMGKEQIFKPPFKHLMMWMGGIPVDRSKSNNLVDFTASILDKSEALVVAVPPEGTRSKVKRWKTGFYHIASKAQVPIVFGFLDYKKKEGGLGSSLKPTGNIDKDMEVVKSFYGNIQGKFPSQYE